MGCTEERHGVRHPARRSHDTPFIAEIYRPAVESTPISFETTIHPAPLKWGVALKRRSAFIPGSSASTGPRDWVCVRGHAQCPGRVSLVLRYVGVRRRGIPASSRGSRGIHVTPPDPGGPRSLQRICGHHIAESGQRRSSMNQSGSGPSAFTGTLGTNLERGTMSAGGSWNSRRPGRRRRRRSASTCFSGIHPGRCLLELAYPLPACSR